MLKDLLEKFEQGISFTEAKNCDPDVFVVNAEELKEKIDKELKNEGWHPIEEGPPQPDTVVLVSFENHRAVGIGIYMEDEQGSGAFYTIGVQKLKFLDLDVIVNAWMELPKSYRATRDRRDSEQKAVRKVRFKGKIVHPAPPGRTGSST